MSIPYRCNRWIGRGSLGCNDDAITGCVVAVDVCVEHMSEWHVAVSSLQPSSFIEFCPVILSFLFFERDFFSYSLGEILELLRPMVY